MAQASNTAAQVEINRYRSLPKPIKVVSLVLPAIGLALFIFYLFSWSISGWILESYPYYYLLYATFGTCVFLTMPARRKDATRVPWYDFLIAVLLFSICFYYSFQTKSIMGGWVPPPGTIHVVLGTILALISLEAGRRVAGPPFIIICLLFGIYPLFADHMPGILWGISLSYPKLIGSFAFGTMGMLGLSAQVMGEIIIGFLLFAGILIASGAGKFFLDLALSLLGRYRGGPAKVAVVASGFFGSLSGLAMSNIVTTGSITIPTMKRIGYPPHYAAAIEAVASTGGIIMPPVMGSVAFIMAIITDIPYAVIVIAAVIPAILYYYGLLVQVDAYAAKAGLKGLPREECPSLLRTLRWGWPYIAVLVFLVFGLIYMRWGAVAPVYASALLVVLSFTKRETMMTPRKAIEALVSVAHLINFLVAVLLPIGLLLIGLTVTGSLTALTADIVTMGQSNVIVILLVAAVICFLFGMINVAAIPYIVLAVTAVPALVTATGFNLISLHFFMIYYLLMAGITPPVCVSAFIAAALAGAPPMKTGWLATRLAIVLYFIPFFFVFNPSLILEGPILETVYLFALCLVGIWILASGLEAHLFKVGRLEPWARVLLVVSGFLIAFPGYGQILTWWMTSIIGAGLTALVVAAISVRKKAVAAKLVTSQ
jgi:TRAP transporter 4TM/12TM fusion protein